MNFSKKDWDTFGANLGGTAFKGNKKTWYDLETFFIDGLLYSVEDSRLFTSFACLFRMSAPVLSPRKLLKIAELKIKTTKEWKILSFLIGNSIGADRNSTKWNNLLKTTVKLSQVKSPEHLFDRKPLRLFAPLAEFGLLSNGLELELVGKYVNPKKFKSHTLIRNKFLGVNKAVADLNFLESFSRELLSLSEVAKLIHYDRAAISEIRANNRFVNEE
jgi:hypothetical protein